MKQIMTDLLLKHNIDPAVIEEILTEAGLENFKSVEEIDSLVADKTREISTESAIELALNKAKAKNVVACKALIDATKVTLVDGKLTGIDEQIEKIMTENPYMFEQETDAYKPTGAVNAQSMNNMTDDEYFTFLKHKNFGGF